MSSPVDKPSDVDEQTLTEVDATISTSNIASGNDAASSQASPPAVTVWDHINFVREQTRALKHALYQKGAQDRCEHDEDLERLRLNLVDTLRSCQKDIEEYLNMSESEIFRRWEAEGLGLPNRLG